jgi:FixJ family two-component response regulator
MIKHNIMLIDDEENILKSLQRLFLGEEYGVYAFTTGNEALEALEEREYSLILSDYRMPELNGIDFLKLAKVKAPEAIRIILTGFADVDVAISAINEGEIYKFVEKPWDNNIIRVHIKRALEHYELLKERKELLEMIKKQNADLKEWNETLEKRVDEKTYELKKAYEELQFTSKIIAGKDEILQFLLSIHTLDESLDLILKVIFTIIPVNKMAVYVAERKSKQMKAYTGAVVKNNIFTKINTGIRKFPPLPIPDLKKVDKSLLTEVSGLNKISPYVYILPIEKDANCLGIFLIDNSDLNRAVNRMHLNMIAGFTSLAAIAINDYFVTSDLPLAEDLYKVLSEIK